MKDTNNTPEEPKDSQSNKKGRKESSRNIGSSRKKNIKTDLENKDNKKTLKSDNDSPSSAGENKEKHDPGNKKQKGKKSDKTEKKIPEREKPDSFSKEPENKKDTEDTKTDYHPDDYPYEDDQYENSYDYVEQPAPEPGSEAEGSKVETDENDDEDSDDGTVKKSTSKSQKGEKGADKEKKMPFLDHLEELRWTILRSLIAIVITSIVSYVFSKEIITFLRSPAPADLQLIFLAPTEGFMIYIKVSIYAGLVIAFPYIAYQFWQFIVPGLFEKEKKFVPHIAFFTTLCFVVGASFAYFVIIPFGMKFLLGFQTDFLAANITIGKYLGFVVTIILVFGVVFELPVLSFFLTKIGLLTSDFMKKNRRYGMVLIFISAAVLTPPDVFTQLMLAGPLIFLYEISIWVSKTVEKKKEMD